MLTGSVWILSGGGGWARTFCSFSAKENFFQLQMCHAEQQSWTEAKLARVTRVRVGPIPARRRARAMACGATRACRISHRRLFFIGGDVLNRLALSCNADSYDVDNR